MIWEMAPLKRACTAEALREGENYSFFFFFGDVGGWARTGAVRGAGWALTSHGSEGAGGSLYAGGDGV